MNKGEWNLYNKKIFNKRTIKCNCCNDNKEFFNKWNRRKTKSFLKKGNFNYD